MIVKLDCAGISFGSPLDHKHLRQWALEIPGVVKWDANHLVVDCTQVSEASLRDLLALFHRYRIPMKQLAQFRNAANESWFASPEMYWYSEVFSPTSSSS